METFVYFKDTFDNKAFRNVHECFSTWNDLVFHHELENGGETSDSQENKAMNSGKKKEDLPPYDESSGQKMDTLER